MPVPFRDAADVEALGAAGYLKIASTRGGTAYLGALFLINARGEPLEFAYNRLQVPDTFLWRRADLRRHAERKLTASLLTVCGRTPVLLLALAGEVGSELFCQDIHLDLPAGRIARPLEAVPFAAVEAEETLAEPEPLHLFWFPRPPEEGSPARRLFERLCSHGLLLEPFARAATGLREVYGEPDAAGEDAAVADGGHPRSPAGAGLDAPPAGAEPARATWPSGSAHRSPEA